jgi:hypothetical protein
MNTYKATIVPGTGGSSIEVRVQANDPFQARQLIMSLYKPSTWYQGPTLEQS